MIREVWSASHCEEERRGLERDVRRLTEEVEKLRAGGK